MDLSRLPAPQVLQPLDFEAILAARLGDLQARLPTFDAFLESDPVVKLQQVDAYRELLLVAMINDVARSMMLAFATGATLEHLAAFYGVARLEVAPASDDQPALLESDADLRARCQLAAEGLAYAGMTGGGYVFRAQTAAPTVKHVAAIKRSAGHVDLVLLGRDGDGTVAPDIVSTVYAALQAEDAVQLTDVVAVRSAEIVPYSATITLLLRSGPDPQLIAATADAAVRAYAADRHRVGQVVYAQMLAAAASIGGVERAIVDIGDVDPGPAGAAWLDALSIVTQVMQ